MNRFIIALGPLAAITILSGCAIFQPMPTPDQCSQATSQLATAQTALAVVQIALDSAQAAGASPAVVARIQRDIGIAQAAVNSLAVIKAQKCGG